MYCLLFIQLAGAAVDHGDAESAQAYYRLTSKRIGFSTKDQIFNTSLDDVAMYLGYTGITGADLQNLPSTVLMDPSQALAMPTASDPSFLNPQKILAGLGGHPIAPGEILATRFFAPKIMNINDPEPARLLGWRKLVRIEARPGSMALQNGITSGIILFNIFTKPGAAPFSSTDESVNTQVMLISDTSKVSTQDGDGGMAALYWLDYDKLSGGGLLSLALVASFDANELDPATTQGKQPYFVPNGCVACHGESSLHSMVNYLDTDHWFDRLETDFHALKASGQPLLVDAGNNDPTTPSFKTAFDTIRRFNVEAAEQAKIALPKHDEVLAAEKWLSIHEASYDHVPPLGRATGPTPQWSGQVPGNAEVLGALDQYCFRCHGTIKFSVFNKTSVKTELSEIHIRLSSDAQVGVKMPPDRPLPDAIRDLILKPLN